MTQPVKCPRGHEVKLHRIYDPAGWYVECLGEIKGDYCWCGPEAKTETAAIREWNRVMRPASKGGKT